MTFIFLGSLGAQAIVNGHVENPSEKPEVALLLLAKHPLTITEVSKKDLSDFGICSGGFISDRLLITAGHCLTNDGEKLHPYLAIPQEGTYKLLAPVATATDYIFENLDGVADKEVCAPGPKPLPQTKTPDIALLVFPAHTAQHWLTVNSTYHPKEDDAVRYFGYGTEYNPYADGGLLLLKNPVLRSGASKVWRLSPQRIGFIGYVNEPFASEGDSGGPVLVNNQLVGVMSTISERCETEFGEDYAILNTSSLLSNAKAQEFFKKVFHQFQQ